MEEQPSTTERPAPHEVQGPPVELSRILVHRLFLTRVDRELDALARRRAAEDAAHPALPDAGELVATGNLRAFARLADVWLRFPTVVEAGRGPSPAELGVLAVLGAARVSGDPRWSGVDLPVGPERLAEVTVLVSALDDLDRDLARSWLRTLMRRATPEERTAAFEGWWREVAGAAAVPVGPDAVSWFDGEPPAERWEDECARALVDAFFHDVSNHEEWPVRTLEDLPWPLEPGDDPAELEIAVRGWLLDVLDLLEHHAYPGGPELVESVLARRRSGRFFA